MRTCLFAILIVSASTFVHAAENAAALSRVTQDLSFLAADELEGRGVGTNGLQKAAEYIRDEFKRLGLKSGTKDGTYFQPFSVMWKQFTDKERTSLVLHGPDGATVTLDLGTDFQPLMAGGSGKANAPIVFVGYGITGKDEGYDDYQNVDTAGKVLLLLRREPQQDLDSSVFDGKKTTSHSYIQTKLKLARQHKAAAVLLVNDPYSNKDGKEQLADPQDFGSQSRKIPFAQITQDVADAIFEQLPAQGGRPALVSVRAVEERIDSTLQPLSRPLEGWTAELKVTFQRQDAQVANVIGVLEGDGPLADETIVIGAHYDHLGFGGYGSRNPKIHAVHNGADDNASGTVALLELARRLSQSDRKPARRIVFMAFSAEERGLLGSRHYVNHPLFPLETTVAMFNFDMVGQAGSHDLLVHGARSGTSIQEAIESAAKNQSLTVKPLAQMTRNSDHFVFFDKKIPAVHFFTGLTKEYHTPEDDLETINLPGIVQVVNVAESAIRTIANQELRPAFQNDERRAFLGVNLTPLPEGDPGVTVASVRNGSPAAQAGVLANDVIRKLNDKPIRKLEDLMNMLQRLKPGNQIGITVERGGQLLTLKVKLGST